MGAPRLQPVHSSSKFPKKRQKPKKIPYFGLFLLLLMALIIVAMATFEDFVVFDTEGNVDISPERKAQLAREYEKLENSQQYVLLVKKPGWFPCYNCPAQDSIYLYIGEVWKYGVTKNGKPGRYGSTLPIPNLQYWIQFQGSIELCLKEEKRKIFYYPKLPENLKRIKRLARPPGNFKDF